MTNEIISVNGAMLEGIKNYDLQRITSEIFAAAQSMVQARRVLASKLATIEANASAVANGESAVAEWCADFEGDTPAKRFESYGLTVLGLKRAQLRDYARIGRVCLDGNGNSLLISGTGQDFGITQLSHVSRLDTDTAKALIASGELSPDMTVSEIKEVVTAHKPVDKAAQEKREKAKAERERKRKIEEGEIVANIEVKIVGGKWFVFANNMDITKSRVGSYLVRAYKSERK